MGGQGCERVAFKFPYLWSSAYCFSPAIDDVASTFTGCPSGCTAVLTSEPALLANLYNNNETLFQSNTAWGWAAKNAANINGLPIHVTIGSLDALVAPNQSMDSLLTSLGINHDALQIVSGYGHDVHLLDIGVSYANYYFAGSHFYQ